MAKKMKARRVVRPAVRRVNLKLTIDQKDVFVVDLMVDRARMPKLNTGQMAEIFANGIASGMQSLQASRAPEATPLDPNAVDFDSIFGRERNAAVGVVEPEALFQHLEDAAKAHEQMRKLGLLYCPTCGAPLKPS